jgi:hypothetical protein
MELSSLPRLAVFHFGRDQKRSPGLTPAFQVNVGSSVDPGARHIMPHVTQIVTLFGSKVRLHRLGNATFVSK